MKKQDTSINAPTPDIEVSVQETFGIDIDMKVPAFSTATDLVPELDSDYNK